MRKTVAALLLSMLALAGCRLDDNSGDTSGGYYDVHHHYHHTVIHHTTVTHHIYKAPRVSTKKR